MGERPMLMVGHAQGPVDRDVRRRADGLGVHRARTSTWRRSTPASSTPAATRRGCSPGPRRAGSGPQVRRSDDLGADLAGDPRRRGAVPRGHRRHGRADLAARPRAPSRTWCTPAPSPARSGSSTDRGETFELEQRALGPPAPRRSGAPGSAARPSTPSSRTRPTRESVTAAISTGGVYQTTDGGGDLGAAQPGHPGGVPARGRAVPRVRAVRAQGRPAPVAARAAASAEPRRRLPQRRRRRGTWT